ncbi:MAG: hypothetical protein ACLQJ0_16265 [Steroidobacteraceae bacterium]
MNLSPVGLVLAAGVVGKAVMAVLFVVSFWCWALIIEGVISVTRLRRGDLSHALAPRRPRCARSCGITQTARNDVASNRK